MNKTTRDQSKETAISNPLHIQLSFNKRGTQNWLNQNQLPSKPQQNPEEFPRNLEEKRRIFNDRSRKSQERDKKMIFSWFDGSNEINKLRKYRKVKGEEMEKSRRRNQRRFQRRQ